MGGYPPALSDQEAADVRTSVRVGLFAAALAAVFGAAYGVGHAVGPADAGGGGHHPRPSATTPSDMDGMDGMDGMGDMQGMDTGAGGHAG